MIEAMIAAGAICAVLCIGHFIILTVKIFKDAFKNNSKKRAN